jgi:hypothetical protein
MAATKDLMNSFSADAASSLTFGPFDFRPLGRLWGSEILRRFDGRISIHDWPSNLGMAEFGSTDYEYSISQVRDEGWCHR